MYKVLIVDDEPVIIHGLCRQAYWDSYNMELADTATNGLDALSILSGQTIDLLVTDVCMPQMDGLALITKAKEINPSLRCIIVSAHDKFDYVKKALKLGVENYLLKPISQGELNDTLAKTHDNLERDRLQASAKSSDIMVFRNNILNRWANGSIQDFELQERAELLHINLRDKEYLVCVLDIIRRGNTEEKHKAAVLLANLCKDTLSPAYGGEYFTNESQQVAIILQGGSVSGLREKLLSVFLDITSRASAQGMAVYASVGPVADSYAKVPASYTSALFHLNCRFISPLPGAVLCEGLPDPSQEDSHTVLKEFAKALGDEDTASALILSQKYMDLQTAGGNAEEKQAALPLLLTLVQAAAGAEKSPEDLPEPLPGQMAGYHALEPGKGLSDWLSATIRKAIQVISAHKKAMHPMVRQSIDQIKKKYAGEISLKTLAAAFNVTPAYLGQLFKEDTGKFFNDYLTDVRLQSARVLLQETDLKISELICRVGIPNQSYFNRMFKSFFGVSPIEYRRQKRQV